MAGPWILLLTLVASSHAMSQELVDGHFIVLLEPDEFQTEEWQGTEAERTRQRALSLLESTGGTLLRSWGNLLPAFLAELDSEQVDRVMESSETVSVEPDRWYPDAFEVAQEGVCGGLPTPPPPTVAGSPPWEQFIQCDDPGASTCIDNYGLDRIDQAELPRDGRFRFGIEWGEGTYPGTGEGVHLYIVDSGINASHVEFAGRVLPGFDATFDGWGTQDCASNSHGTMVAGVAAGSTYGVAKKAWIHPVRIAGCTQSGVKGSWILNALDWVAGNHRLPAVVNLSFNAGRNSSDNDGDPWPMEMISDFTERLILIHGLPVVNSAGNYNDVADNYSPTDVEEVIVAGGTIELSPGVEGRWYSYPNHPGGQWNPSPQAGSNYGEAIDVWAPAVGIVSASRLGSAEGCRLTGTSFSAPLVSGAVAILLQEDPTLSPFALEELILATATCEVLPRSGLYDIHPDSRNAMLRILSRPLATVRLGPACD